MDTAEADRWVAARWSEWMALQHAKPKTRG